MKFLLSSILAVTLAASGYSATVFSTTLGGNAAVLGDQNLDGTSGDGVTSGDTVTLSLTGGGTIDLVTSDVAGGNTLFMDNDSMGHGNDKWGASQNWTFSFDQTISFDGLGFKTPPGTQPMVLRSTAWKDDTAASGTGWSFTSNGTTGTFDLSGTSDFTAAGVSNVAAGTSIEFGYFGSTTGGTELSSFTISVVPEPSSFALLAGFFGFAWILVRRR